MSKWASEGKDWIQVMEQGPPRKEDVAFNRCKQRSVPTKKPRYLAPPALDVPVEDNKLVRQQNNHWLGQRTCKTVDERGHISSVQNVQRDWWGRGVDLRHSAADWPIHIFSEHNKETDSWAG